MADLRNSIKWSITQYEHVYRKITRYSMNWSCSFLISSLFHVTVLRNNCLVFMIKNWRADLKTSPNIASIIVNIIDVPLENVLLSHLCYRLLDSFLLLADGAYLCHYAFTSRMLNGLRKKLSGVKENCA